MPALDNSFSAEIAARQLRAAETAAAPVDVVTWIRVGRSVVRFRSRENFSFIQNFQTSLGSTQRSFQYLPGTPSSGLKRGLSVTTPLRIVISP